MLGLKLALISSVAAGVIAAGGMYYHMDGKIDQIKTAHELVISDLNLKSETYKNTIIELNNAHEEKLSEQKEELNDEYSTKVRELNATITRLANVRLRDPGDRDKDRGSASCPNSGTADSPAGTDPSELSGQASEFLLGLAAEADITRERLKICIAWADQVRKSNREQIEAVKDQNSGKLPK